MARNGEEEKREKAPGNWSEESRFPGIAHPRVFWEIFFEGTEYVNNFQWGTFSCYGYCQSRLN